MANPRSLTSTLAGLVSAGAETLYNRLRLARYLPVAQFREYGAPAEELLDRGLVFRSGDGDELIRPVEPHAALRLLLDQEQQRLTSTHQRLLGGWDQLMALLPATADGEQRDGIEGIRLLASFDEVVTKAAELYPSAKRRLRGTENGIFHTRPTKDRIRVPPPSLVQAGVRYQMIYQADYLDSAAGSAIIERSAQAGELVRLRSRVPVKMLHVDDSVALVAADQGARTALVIRAPAVLAMLADWFDLMWADPSTVDYPNGRVEMPLTEAARRVLSMMPFDDDEAIARKLRVSVSTVRRHIKSAYEILGVNNRFAAGMAATKLDWI